MAGTPCRSSSRVRKPVGVKVEECETTNGWTKLERENLLMGMKMYGVLDLKNLHALVPTKNPDRIRQYIFEQAKNARHLRERRLLEKHKERKRQGLVDKNATVFGPLDMWLRKMRSNMPSNYDEARAVSLAKAIQFIALYEKHPDPSLCRGVDFRAMYEFLFYMMNGLPPKDVDPITSQFMLSCMSRFAKSLRKGNQVHRTFLSQHRQPTFTSDNPDFIAAKCTENTSPTVSMEQLLKIPGFNPFNIPPEFLLKKL